MVACHVARRLGLRRRDPAGSALRGVPRCSAVDAATSFTNVMLDRGFLVLGRFLGARVKLHWTIPLGALLFSGFHPSLGFVLAFPALIFMHELGHAILVAHFGHRVVGIEATGMGGQCQWSGNASPFEEAVIAWGGVLAQLLLLALTQLWLWRVATPHTAFGWQVVNAFTHSNFYLMAVNLLPIPPLDGARAWTIFTSWNDRGPRGVPYGTWRGASPDAQRAWFDGLRKQSPSQNSARTRFERARVPSVRPDVHPSEDGTLEPKNQRALDDLLRRTTGKVRRVDKRGE